jgi:hypothetical protein
LRGGWSFQKKKWSERQDLNLRRLAPKASALAKLSYAPTEAHHCRIFRGRNDFCSGFVLDAFQPGAKLALLWQRQHLCAPPKINLRRPDIMEAVQAKVLSHYRSELVERIRANGGILTAGALTVKLAKEFGFCYGVERAIDLAYAATKYFADVPRRRPFICWAKSFTTRTSTTRFATSASKSFHPSPPKRNWSGCNRAMR